MGSSSAGMGLFWLRGWHTPFVLFLAFLVSVTPLLAEVQNDVASRRDVQATASTIPVTPQRFVSSYFISLDLFGRGNLLDPSSLLLPPGAVTKSCEAGRADADAEVGGTLWFILGLFLWGVLFAYIITPSVPEGSLKGKTTEYVRSYTQCYQEVAKSIHVKWAWYGAATTMAVGMIVLGIMLLTNTGMSN